MWLWAFFSVAYCLHVRSGRRAVTSTSSTGSSSAPPPGYMPEADPNNTTVFVGNIEGLGENDLRMAFSPFGTITSIRIPGARTCGFVVFLEKWSATQAIASMNGQWVGEYSNLVQTALTCCCVFFSAYHAEHVCGGGVPPCVVCVSAPICLLQVTHRFVVPGESTPTRHRDPLQCLKWGSLEPMGRYRTTEPSHSFSSSAAPQFAHLSWMTSCKFAPLVFGMLFVSSRRTAALWCSNGRNASTACLGGLSRRRASEFECVPFLFPRLLLRHGDADTLSGTCCPNPLLFFVHSVCSLCSWGVLGLELHFPPL